MEAPSWLQPKRFNKDKRPSATPNRCCSSARSSAASPWQASREVDYKDVDVLRDFISENGKIIPARLTGTRAIYQRQVTTAIKRALPGHAALQRPAPRLIGANNMQIILLDKVVNLGGLGDIVRSATATP